MRVEIVSRSRTKPLVAMVAAAIGLMACGPSESVVKEEIDAANYCSVAGECADVGTDCPFGCNILVNAAEADRIRELIDDYHAAHPNEECMYGCVASYGTECRAGKCENIRTPP